MAKIIEQNMIVKLNKLVKDRTITEDSDLMPGTLISELEDVIQALVGADVVVEIVKVD